MTGLSRRSRDSSVGVGTGYRLDGRGSITGRDKIFVSIPKRQDRLCGPPYTIGIGEFFPGVLRRGVKLTTHLHLVPKSRMVEL
jgi:hypothetical protein